MTPHSSKHISDILHGFNDGPSFSSHLAEDVIVEFPYGPTLGVPARLEGREAAGRHLLAVWQSGLRIRDVVVTPLPNDSYLAEYVGDYRMPDGTVVASPLVGIITMRGEKIVALREYWNTKQLADAQQASGSA